MCILHYMGFTGMKAIKRYLVIISVIYSMHLQHETQNTSVFHDIKRV